jgi:PAS domain S-box-containing protein
LTRLWQAYRAAHERLLRAAMPDADRRSFYHRTLLPQARAVKIQAQRVIDLNLQNIVSIDGQVRQNAVQARRAMYLLLIVGALVAVVFVGMISRSILAPLRTLTQSAREIEQGNLDLVVPVRSYDEAGQLAEAFNSMAARLREFRRSDRARLVRTQRTTQLAVDSLPDAIAIVSPDGMIELANQAAQQVFGLRPDTAIDQAPIPDLRELYRQAAREGRPIQPRGYDAAIQIFDGQERFFLPQAVPILDEEHQPVGVTLVLTDVTNLRRLDEMKSSLLSTVSHELKTPLTSIRMATHLLLEERIGPLNPKQIELLVAARDDSTRLYQIIESLLDMSRIESGRALLDLKPLAVEQLVLQEVESVDAAFRERGITLESEIPPDTPPVLADPQRIHHVFLNLLNNALQYTSSGGHVQLLVQNEPEAVRFTVKDTGCGIPPQYIPRLFERFYRVPGQSTPGGAGLGLAIVREIVEAHGGHIRVESQVDVGSAFSFTLPRTDARKEEDVWKI